MVNDHIVCISLESSDLPLFGTRYINSATPDGQFVHQSKLFFSSLYNCSAVKLPMEPWPILSPMTPPPPIMLQMPSNLIKTPAYYVQDPMPAILGLAPYQSWKPNVRNQVHIKNR